MKNKTISILLLLLFIGIGNSAMSQIAKFKALYIYNICKYVEWPENNGSENFTIAIIGNDMELISSIQSITNGKTLANKKIIVKKIKDVNASKNCNVLFFVKGKEEQIGVYNDVAKNGLFIAEKQGALDKGAAINFFLDNNKLKFDLKAESATNNGLLVSGGLESLASTSY